MADAKNDQNFNRTLIAVSTSDGETPVRLEADPTTGALLTSVGGTVSDTNYATKITVVGAVTYIGRAVPGTAQSSALWQAQKIDETTGTLTTWADGNANFDNVATDLTTLTYS